MDTTASAPNVPKPQLNELKAENFPALKNDLILRAAMGLKTERVPIWCHRQAGRYLPDIDDEKISNINNVRYHSVRNIADFFTICRTPHLACEITLQPIRRFPLDAAIIFSDILVIPQAMGLEVKMVKGKGPVLPQPLKDPEHMKRLKKLKDIDVKKDLGYVMQAITLTRHRLEGKVPIIGFSGAPWTLMAYMVQGEGAKSYYKAKTWLYKYPHKAHELMEMTAVVIIDYLVAQVEAGAQMLEVFDSWAGDLTQEAFAEFSLPYLKKIATKVKAKLRERKMEVVPMTIFARGADWALEELANSDYDVLSLNWTVNPIDARKQVGSKSLQGNLEPAVLFADGPRIRSEAAKMVKSFGTHGYIANLGHGMLPSMKPEALEVFVDEVHKCSESMAKGKKRKEAST